MKTKHCFKEKERRVGLGRVVREVRQHPEDHEFKSLRNSELTFRSYLLLTARGGSTRALIEFACLPCYPGNTLCSQRLEPPGRAG
jgi:hypothetical protein